MSRRFKHLDRIDNLRILMDAPNQLQGDLRPVVMVNDQLLLEPEYVLDAHSFFEALDTGSNIRFVGGCGTFDCCGIAFRCRFRSDCWEWGKRTDETKFAVRHTFAWLNVLEAAEVLMFGASRLAPTLRKRKRSGADALGYFQAQIDELRERVSDL